MLKFKKVLFGAMFLLLLVSLTGCSSKKEIDNKIYSLGIMPGRFIEEFNSLAVANRAYGSPDVRITNSEITENGALFLALSNRGDKVGMLCYVNKNNDLLEQVTVIGPGRSIMSSVQNRHITLDERLWVEAMLGTLMMFNRNGISSLENVFERLDKGEALVSPSDITKFKLQKLDNGYLAFSITGIDNPDFGLDIK